MPAKKAPPSPDGCEHPEPISGVLAHAFGFYAGAQGPEGVRRTATYYGPVIGGLPVRAWHCPRCGLLRIFYPDGRTEEQRLHPGPQPGLIAQPTAVDPGSETAGRQARVSGITGSPSLFAEMERVSDEPMPQSSNVPWFRARGMDVTTWLAVTALVVVGVGLFAAGFFAVYDYQTPDIEGPLVAIIAALFGTTVIALVGSAAARALASPHVTTSTAVVTRGRPQLDPATGFAVTMLGLAALGLLVAGVLSVYDYETPGAVGPVMVVTLACASFAGIVLIGTSTTRHFKSRHG